MFHFTNEVGQDLQSVLNARKAWADRALCPEVATITTMSASISNSLPASGTGRRWTGSTGSR